MHEPTLLFFNLTIDFIFAICSRTNVIRASKQFLSFEDIALCFHRIGLAFNYYFPEKKCFRKFSHLSVESCVAALRCIGSIVYFVH